MTEEGSSDNPDADIYRAPQAELLDEPKPEPEFYIVAPRKFLLLYLGTWGLYEVYWFYRHWRLYRDWHGLKLWPVPRAIFSIFFVYPLFSRIAASAAKPAADNGRRVGTRLPTSCSTLSEMSASFRRPDRTQVSCWFYH